MSVTLDLEDPLTLTLSEATYGISANAKAKHININPCIIEKKIAIIKFEVLEQRH